MGKRKGGGIVTGKYGEVLNNVGNGANGWSFPQRVESYLKKELRSSNVLHLFGGRARFGIRMDVDLITRPHVIADAWMPPFGQDSFDVVLLDPPYIQINRTLQVALLHKASWIARERVVWFHTMFVDHGPGLKLERAVAVFVGDGAYMRCLSFMRVLRPKRSPAHVHRGPLMRYSKWLAGERSLPFEAVSGVHA